MRDLFVDYERLYELLAVLGGEAARRAIRAIDGGGVVPLADHLFDEYEASGNGCGMGAWSRGCLADDDDELFMLEERAALVSVNRSLGIVRLERSVPEEAIDAERLMGEFDLPEAKARGLANRYRRRLAETMEVAADGVSSPGGRSGLLKEVEHVLAEIAGEGGANELLL